jgi:DNA polymerase-1
VKTALLIDGDILVHQVALVCEVPIQWTEDLWTLHSDIGEASRELDRRISDLREHFPEASVIIALSSRTNWRKGVMPTYKSNRKATRKPLVWKPLRDYLADKYDTREFDGLEGDDTLALLATAPNPDAERRIIVSLDKDFNSVPGLTLNWRHAADAAECGVIDSYEEALMEHTPADADLFFLTQAVAGDATDGYPGCPGVGMVRAKKFLEEGLVLERTEKVLKSGPRKGQTVEEWVPGRPGTPWEVAVSVYAAAGLGEEVALQNARVARLLRHGEFNPETGDVTLWAPTTQAPPESSSE